jgi:hypothetical protein
MLALGITEGKHVKNDNRLAFWLTGKQFLNLAAAAAREIVDSGNKSGTFHSGNISSEEVHAQHVEQTKWADHNMAVPILFNMLHGIELMLKGFHPGKIPRAKGHQLFIRLEQVEKIPGTCEFSSLVRQALHGNGGNLDLMHRFFAENSVDIEAWYEALRYPASLDGSKQFIHRSLTFQESDALEFWREVTAFSELAVKKAYEASKQSGLLPDDM